MLMEVLWKKKLKKIYYKKIGPLFAKRFKFTDFSIISNNCFGGIIYRNHHLPYLTPTVGLFIMPKDYIKFIYNIKYYLNIEPVEISIDNSKYSSYLKSIKYNGFVGKLDDIELMLLHYNNFNEAKVKWNKRKKRINFDKIIYKFNDQNNCTIEDLEAFNNFTQKNKILFTAQKYDSIDSYVLKKFEKDGYVVDDTKNKNIKKYFNIYNYINNTMR